MWLFTRYGYFSVASANKPDGKIDPQTLMVRARRISHLRTIVKRFPSLAGVEIVTWKERDYRYRIVVGKTVWSEIVDQMVKEQEWSNFKDEAAKYQDGLDSNYLHALHRVWSVMNNLQLQESRE
jgi:hypothetical protein